MEAYIDENIVSTATLSHYIKNGRGIPSFAYNSFNEKTELIDLLFQYHEILGVDAYEEYKDQSLFWRIGQDWYTPNQIDRMLKLKIFT